MAKPRRRDGLPGLGWATFLVSAGTALARGIGFLSSIAAAAILRPTEFGIFGYLAVTAGVISAIGVLGLAPLTTRAIAASRTTSDARDITTLALGAASATLCFAGSVYVLLAVVAPGVDGAIFTMSKSRALLVGAWGASAGLTPLLSAVFAGHRAFGKLTHLTIVRALLVALGTVLGALTFDTALAAAAGAVLGEILTAGGCLCMIGRAGWIAGSPIRACNRGGAALLRGALGAGIASLGIQVAMWIGQRLLVSTPGGFAENGGFSLASRLTLVVTFVPSALALSALPDLSRIGEPPAARLAQARGVIRLCLLISSLFASSLAALAYLAFTRFGGAYAAYAGAIAAMSLGAIFISLNNVLGTVAVANQRIRLWVGSDIVLALALILGAVSLVQRYQATGLVIAYVVAYALSCAVLLPAVGRVPAHRNRGQRRE